MRREEIRLSREEWERLILLSQYFHRKNEFCPFSYLGGSISVFAREDNRPRSFPAALFEGNGKIAYLGEIYLFASSGRAVIEPRTGLSEKQQEEVLSWIKEQIRLFLRETEKYKLRKAFCPFCRRQIKYVSASQLEEHVEAHLGGKVYLKFVEEKGVHLFALVDGEKKVVSITEEIKVQKVSEWRP